MSTSKKANDFTVKLLGTMAQTGDTVAKGAFKAYEGIADSVATIGAAATQRLLPDVSKSLQAFVQEDLYEKAKTDGGQFTFADTKGFYKRTVNGTTYTPGSGQMIEEGVLDDVKIPLASITKNKLNDITLNDVLYQVANMAPSVLTGAGFGQVGSLATLGLSAGGTSAEEAFDQGATAEQALAYGVASGLVEVGTEKISDAFGLMTGGKGGLLDKIIPSTTIAGRLAKGAAGEAFEEAVSESVNPLLRRIYDTEALQNVKDNPGQYWADIANSAIMGGVTSLAMAPLGSGNIVDDVETKKTLTERARQLEANGKLTTEKATKLNEQIAKANANIETKLKKMNETERAKTIAALKLNGFDDSGAYVQKTYERAKYSTIGTETHNVNEIASKAGFETSTELTQDQERVFGTVKKNLAKLQAKGLETDGIVVVKENQTNAGQTFAGANADGIIFVNENRLNELSSALQTLAHESTHSLPMSFETLSLLDAVMNDEANGQAVRDVLTNYDVTQEEWNNAKKAFENGTSDARQAKIVDETGAAFSENILGNEDAMRVLTRNNSGLVVKAYNAICDAIKLKQLTGAAKSEYKLMLDYAKAFEKAMTSEGIDFVPMSGDEDKDEAKYSQKKSSISAENYRIVKKAIKGIDVTDAEAVAMEAYKQHNPIRNWTKDNAAEAERAERINSSSRERVAAVMSYNADVLNTENGKAIAENYGITQEELDELRARREEAEKEADAKKAQSSRKSYSYEEAQGIIEKVIDNLSDEKSYADLPKTTRRVLTSTLRNTLNSTRDNRAGYVKDIADRIIKDADIWNAEEVDAQNDYVRSGDYENDMHELEILKSYLRKIDVKNIKGEIKHKYDDKAKNVLKRWASNIATENPVTADTVLHDNNELHLKDVQDGDNEADIFFAINNRYEDLKARTEKVKPYKLSFQDEQAKNRFAVELMTEILNEADALGKNTETTEEQYSEYIAKYLAKKETARQIENAEERAAYAKDELASIKNRLTELSSKAQGTANLIHKIAVTADELHAMTDRKYAQTHNIPVAANLYTDEEFRGVVKACEKLFRDGLIDPKKVRTQIDAVAKLLSQKEVFDKYVNDVAGSEENASFISELLENTRESFADHFDDTTNEFTNDVLSYAELKNTSDLLSFVKHIYTHYDTVFRNGKAYSAEKLSVAEQEILEKSASVNVKNKKTNPFKQYKKWFTTPISVFEHVELYDDDGELTRLSRELRKQTWVKQDEYLKLTEKLDEFGKKNKHFLKNIRTERVTVEGQSMLLTEFINMRAQFTQENGRLTIEEGGGIIFHDKNGNKSKPTNFTKEGIEAAWDKLDASVHEYYDLIYEIANEGGKLKAATDMQLYGYTDVKGDGKYFQLRRERRYFKSYAGDASKMSSDAQSVFNSAINKKRSKNAMKIPLAAQDSFANITEYVNQVTNYYAYAVTLSEFRRIYNKQTETGKSMRFMLEEAWDGDTNEIGGDKYLSKYLNDIQGIKTGESFAWLGKLRGAYAQAQLGMNIKVIGGQFCSFPTAFAYLNISDMQKGLLTKTDYGNMMQYSVLARTRFDSNTAFRSETLTDNINAIGAIGSVGISWADKMTIGKIWNACVAHFSENYNGDELYTKAAELFDEVVTNTQPTYQASDRSQFQRSNNELVKSFAMFTSVQMKQISELFSSIDRVHTYNAMSKAGYKVSDNVQNEAVHKMCKTAAGVVVANAVYAAMCQLVKHMFDKDEEEDNNGRKWFEQMGMQFLETNVSMFPVLKEVYGYFVNGYDLDVNVVGSMNDLLSSIKSLASADSTEEFAKGLKNVSFYGCMMLGVPARNTYNLVYGLTKRFSKPTAMKIDSWFTTKKTYGSALNSAVEKGDTKMINTILQIQSGVDGLPSVYNSLMENGYVDILPRSVGTSFNYDGEQYEMTKKEQAQFRETYTGYAKAVSDMARTVVFKTATDEVKAKAIKAIQNTYWQMAIDETVGDETTAKLYVFSKAIGIGKLAVITEVCKAYSADKDDEGHSIAGSKKAKIVSYLRQSDLNQAQQAMVLAYLGYTDSSAKQKVRAYINSLNITKEEKAILFAMCGY